VIGNGAGANADVRSAYADEIALAGDPQRLVDRVALLLTGSQLDASTRVAIRDAVAAIPTTSASAAANRARLAVFLVMAAPEFNVMT
jgi:hypothetical protein